MPGSIVIQQPPGSAGRLLLLCHSVNGGAPDLLPLGELLASSFPDAFVVSVESGQASALDDGHDWFAVRGLALEIIRCSGAQVLRCSGAQVH